MLLMGLREFIYWSSWIIAYALMSATTVFVLVSSPFVDTSSQDAFSNQFITGFYIVSRDNYLHMLNKAKAQGR